MLGILSRHVVELYTYILALYNILIIKSKACLSLVKIKLLPIKENKVAVLPD